MDDGQEVRAFLPQSDFVGFLCVLVQPVKRLGECLCELVLLDLRRKIVNRSVLGVWREKHLQAVQIPFKQVASLLSRGFGGFERSDRGQSGGISVQALLRVSTRRSPRVGGPLLLASHGFHTQNLLPELDRQFLLLAATLRCHF